MMVDEMVIIIENLIIFKRLDVAHDIFNVEIGIIWVVALIINFEDKHQSLNTGTGIESVGTGIHGVIQLIVSDEIC